MIASAMERPTLPLYLRTAHEIAIWHALAAAADAIRERADTRFLGDRSEADLDETIRYGLIPQALAEQERLLPPGVHLPSFAAQILFSMLRGYGELDQLFLDPEVSEIIIDGPDQEVYVERHGVLEGTRITLTRERLLYLIERMSGSLGQLPTDARPIQEIRLPMARATAVHERLAFHGPALVVRLRGRRRLLAEDLIALNTIPRTMWDALRTAFTGGANVLIAGEVSSGKTTLLQALLAALPSERRIVTIEDPIEIDLQRPRTEQLEVRHPNQEGAGDITHRDLVRLSLRLRPDHLIIGEVRDGAAWDMVDAMSLGHNGTVTTIHAGSPIQAVTRLESLCLRADDVPSLDAVRRAIAEAVNLVVQLERVPAVVNGQPCIRRVVTEIVELVGLARPGQDAPAFRLVPLAVLHDGVLHPTDASPSPTLVRRLGTWGITVPGQRDPSPQDLAVPTG